MTQETNDGRGLPFADWTRNFRTEAAEGEPEGPFRCHHGSKTDNPCWRRAIVAPSDSPEGTLPTLCEEHERASALTREAEDLWADLDALQAVIRGYLDEIEESHEGATGSATSSTKSARSSSASTSPPR